MNQNILEILNPEQKAAVTHSKGPLLIIAGAGSGKTMTLACRVGHLIKSGIDPSRILLLTFTRRAASEMLKRSILVIGEGNEAKISQVWGGTFHSIANRLLRIYSNAIGLNSDFTIIDQADAEDLIDVIREDFNFEKKGSRFPRKGTCLAIYSRKVNSGKELDVILSQHFPWCERWEEELSVLFTEYITRKIKRKVLDYDDLLLYWSFMLEDPEISKSLEDKFEHILVDEYQDTNLIQAKILQNMRKNNKNITVVGDDAQSIYSFRSATVKNILDFPKQFSGTTVIKLERNYRSTTPILDTSNVLIAQAKNRYTKSLWTNEQSNFRPCMITCKDEQAQDSEVVRLILARYEEGISLRKQAVLFRSGNHSASLEIALSSKNIPFVKYGGLRFMEFSHIKDVLAYLRILENPRDELAWFRILKLEEGIGPATAAKAYLFVTENSFNPESIASFHERTMKCDFDKLGNLFRKLSLLKGVSSDVDIETVLGYYKPLLEKNYENPEARIKDIEQLAGLATGYDSRSKFIDEMVLDPPLGSGMNAGKPFLEEDFVILSTIHSAKGLEWDTVYLIHAADGWLPSDMSTGKEEDIEEELRIAYVAMTRAKSRLYVLWPKRYYTKPGTFSDNHIYAQRSRFFTSDVLATMEATSCGVENDRDSLFEGQSKVDIEAKLKRMWK